MALKGSSKYLIVGAGVHGLSTAYHLALRLKASRKGSGSDIQVVDKTGIAAGASGIACGVIRNNYFQPAMRELMAHSVDVWDSDPTAFSYHPVGYMQISPESMIDGVASIAEQQKDIGYESVFVEGAKQSKKYMTGLFNDWQAQNITSVLHEKRGGYANNVPSMMGLAAKARAEGVSIHEGVEVLGYESANTNSDAIQKVITDQGAVECDHVVISVGPWIKRHWDMLELPDTIPIKDQRGITHQGNPMWTFWSLQEGTLGVEPEFLLTDSGDMPPVIHVDTDAPLIADDDGAVLSEALWGIYYKPDFNFGGIQGGAVPDKITTPPKDVKVDPYGPESPDYVMGQAFARYWVSALAHCQKRFEGMLARYKDEPSGGIGCLTPDSFPVFDVFRENCYIIADSNHGYKMMGVGKLVAEEIAGSKPRLLDPFRFSRYAEGRLHPVSSSPFPWS